MKGVDPMTFSLNRFLNFVYTWATRNSDEKAHARFDQWLFAPPPEERARPLPKESPWSAENERSALSGLAAALRG